MSKKLPLSIKLTNYLLAFLFFGIDILAAWTVTKLTDGYWGFDRVLIAMVAIGIYGNILDDRSKAEIEQ